MSCGLKWSSVITKKKTNVLIAVYDKFHRFWPCLFKSSCSKLETSVHGKTAQSATLLLVSVIVVKFSRCHPNLTEKGAGNQNYNAKRFAQECSSVQRREESSAISKHSWNRSNQEFKTKFSFWNINRSVEMTCMLLRVSLWTYWHGRQVYVAKCQVTVMFQNAKLNVQQSNFF